MIFEYYFNPIDDLFNLINQYISFYKNMKCIEKEHKELKNPQIEINVSEILPNLKIKKIKYFETFLYYFSTIKYKSYFNSNDLKCYFSISKGIKNKVFKV